MIKHIVLDVGGVLLRWEPHRPFLALIPDNRQRQWFLDDVCNEAWNREQNRGRSWAAAEARLISRFPQQEALIRAYRFHWRDMVPGPIEGTPELMASLINEGWDVTLLTNFNQETFPIALEMYPFLDKARGRTVSGDVGMVKPEAQIYDHHGQTFGLDPQSTLFFDDMPANVASAERAGWHARRFRSSAHMQDDLAQFGISL